MKWKHIQDEQPAHDEEIIQCNPPYSDGHYTMGMRKYYQTCPWQDIVEYCEKSDWTPYDFFWIAAKDFPFPEERK